MSPVLWSLAIVLSLGASGSTSGAADVAPADGAADKGEQAAADANVNVIRIPEPEEVEPTVVAFREYDDPWEPFNRRIFAFNDALYRHALIPVSRAYTGKVPEALRDGIGRFFSNLREPLFAINNSLQGDLNDAGRNIVRFATNSTVGLLGIFDPATTWLGIEDEETTLNHTLRDWKVGTGPFLVLPVLGPTDLRRGSAGAVETLVHPLRLMLPTPEDTISIGFDNFQGFAPLTESYLTLRQESDDPYIYFRNRYLQGRERDEFYLEEGAANEPR